MTIKEINEFDMASIGLLSDMKEILSDPDRWCKGSSAVNAEGEWVDVSDKGACKFCMIGAQGLASIKNNDQARLSDKSKLPIRNALRNVLYKKYKMSYISHFNDHPDTTHEMVLGVIDEAIEFYKL